MWNQHSQHPVLKLTEHTAAVKAITWSPHQNGLLASGGGTADRCIRFWNTTSGNQLNSIDTGSQVAIESFTIITYRENKCIIESSRFAPKRPLNN